MTFNLNALLVLFYRYSRLFSACTATANRCFILEEQFPFVVNIAPGYWKL